MMPSERGRWMAIDWGERRIGLAISDPIGNDRVAGRRHRAARGQAAADRRAGAARRSARGARLRDRACRSMARATTRRARPSAGAWRRELAKRTRLPVALVDERYTTADRAPRRCARWAAARATGRATSTRSRRRSCSSMRCACTSLPASTADAPRPTPRRRARAARRVTRCARRAACWSRDRTAACRGAARAMRA